MDGPKALICTAVGKVEVQTVTKPTPPAGHVLVKTKAVALNPTDYKSIHEPHGSAIGKRPGVDFSGIIEEVGPEVSRPWKKGDRVAGGVFGAKDAESGAFGDYVVVREYMLLRLPDSMPFDRASTLGVGLTTCGQALYELLGLPLPPALPETPPHTILIGGGSTATATLGIQYAKLSGFRVIATASPYNFEYLQSLGADIVLDYRESSDVLVEAIKQATGGNLTLAWDCSPNDRFHEVAARAMSSTEKGIYATVNPLTPSDFLAEINPMVETKWQLAYTVFGEEFSFGPITFPASEEDAAFGAAFWERTAKLLAEGKLQPTRCTVNRGGEGLHGVIAGLDELSQGKVAGTKLVYSMD